MEQKEFGRPELLLNFDAQAFLREAGKWAIFLGILGFITCGFILLMALFADTFIGAIAHLSPGADVQAMTGLSVGISFIYVLIAAWYFLVSRYLYLFGRRVRNGILYVNPVEIANATKKLKSFFKLWGITTIVIIAIYALAIIFFVVIGVGAETIMHSKPAT